VCAQSQGCADDAKGLLEQPAQGYHLFQGPAGTLLEAVVLSGFCLMFTLFVAAVVGSFP
jgi:hypothetical protein